MTPESRWTIYCHTHIESGKSYVGLTKKTVSQRWNQHVYTARQTPGKNGWSHFANAIRAYGKDAFSHRILEVCSTQEEATASEIRWIKELDTQNPDRGFNLRSGGYYIEYDAARKNPWEDPEFRKKVTKSITRKWEDPDLRARMSDISKEINSRAEVKKKIGDAARGRVFSEETRAKISANASRQNGRKHSPETRKLISRRMREIRESKGL